MAWKYTNRVTFVILLVLLVQTQLGTMEAAQLKLQTLSTRTKSYAQIRISVHSMRRRTPISGVGGAFLILAISVLTMIVLHLIMRGVTQRKEFVFTCSVESETEYSDIWSIHGLRSPHVPYSLSDRAASVSRAASITNVGFPPSSVESTVAYSIESDAGADCEPNEHVGRSAGRSAGRTKRGRSARIRTRLSFQLPNGDWIRSEK